MRKRITLIQPQALFETEVVDTSKISQLEEASINLLLPGVLFITSYPPCECGIATYSQDLLKALNNKFKYSFSLKVCAIESKLNDYSYGKEVKYIFNTSFPKIAIRLANDINDDESIQIVVVQHEFGFFNKHPELFLRFLSLLEKPIIVTFHTVLQSPDESLMQHVQKIVNVASSVVVMTKFSSEVLQRDYRVNLKKVTVIPHGTHLVSQLDKDFLKAKYNLSGKTILSTFGLLGSGKGIETTLDALPAIVLQNPNILFLIIGKTHPTVVQQEGEVYRQMLKNKVTTLKLEKYVKFINAFLPTHTLLEYLQLSDIYLFTSKDPNQAVSGTFAYANSCGCPVISTPIPHAVEVLQNNADLIFDFGDSEQLSEKVITLLKDSSMRQQISSDGIHRMASTAWENSAIAHAILFEKISNRQIHLHYRIPELNLDHIKKMTTNLGIVQFAQINHPDLDTGYTLDDNARALVAFCQHYEITTDSSDLVYISIYFQFIRFCLQPDGYFYNYVDEAYNFTAQNTTSNLDDSNGRAIWALGYLISICHLFPVGLQLEAEKTLQDALPSITKIHSTRAMGFAIKGLYYANLRKSDFEYEPLIEQLSDRLVQMFRHESNHKWEWFESYLTYANSILPEAMLCAWLSTQKPIYKNIAKLSFDFLLSKIYTHNSIKVISNKNWLHKGDKSVFQHIGGEQPIDITYTILALKKFYDVFGEKEYLDKIEIAFNWFLGNNYLRQIIYNPCTGGCYDGLEKHAVNLNQGAESTVSYLMARLTVEKLFGITQDTSAISRTEIHLLINYQEQEKIIE